MKKYYAIFFLLVSTTVFSQEDAWVYFNGKPNAQTYLDTPTLMLSQRALDRRTNQNIALDFTDVPVETTYVNQIKASTGITVMAQSKWLNALHIRGTQADVLALKLLSFVDKVVFANKMLNTTSRKVNDHKVAKANDKLKTTINYNYGTSANQIQMLNGHLLHQQNYTGSGKIIAVLDGGFPGVNTAQPFQKLRDNNQILGGYDYVSRNANFYAGSSHGTMVLSTMGGYKDSQLVGTAPDASYYLFITEDGASEGPVEESLWVEAAEEADRLGVDIITTSLGYFGDFTKPEYSHTYSDMNGATTFVSRGAEIAFSKGIIVLASAGNEGGAVEKHIGAPADAVSVITVGAVTATELRSGFSSIGPSFDGRTKPDVMAQGSLAVVSDISGTIGTASGTSFSCPIMAGMVACLWQAFPTMTNRQIRDLVIKSADKYSSPDNQYGYGIPDYSLALANGLGTTGFLVQKNVFIYPNPTTDVITVSFIGNNDSGTVSIYSILGQKIGEQTISKTSPDISLQSLQSGIYLYEMKLGGKITTGKLIKQ